EPHQRVPAVGALASDGLLFHRNASRRGVRLALVEHLLRPRPNPNTEQSHSSRGKLAEEQDEHPIYSDAATSPRGAYKAARQDQATERVCLPESRMEGAQCELGHKG